MRPQGEPQNKLKILPELPSIKYNTIEDYHACGILLIRQHQNFHILIMKNAFDWKGMPQNTMSIILAIILIRHLNALGEESCFHKAGHK